MQKKVWRHWISGNSNLEGRYYEFKSFKVYWAYRWHIAENLEKNIITEYKGIDDVKVIRTTEYIKGYFTNSYREHKDRIDWINRIPNPILIK